MMYRYGWAQGYLVKNTGYLEKYNFYPLLSCRVFTFFTDTYIFTKDVAYFIYSIIDNTNHLILFPPKPKYFIPILLSFYLLEQRFYEIFFQL